MIPKFIQKILVLINRKKLKQLQGILRLIRDEVNVKNIVIGKWVFGDDFFEKKL